MWYNAAGTFVVGASLPFAVVLDFHTTAVGAFGQDVSAVVSSWEMAVGVEAYGMVLRAWNQLLVGWALALGVGATDRILMAYGPARNVSVAAMGWVIVAVPVLQWCFAPAAVWLLAAGFVRDTAASRWGTGGVLWVLVTAGETQVLPRESTA